MDLAMTGLPTQDVTTAGHRAAGDEDVRLLSAYRLHGDREALVTLMRSHADAAYRLALRLSGNAADAEDALQDAFIALLASAHRYRGDGSVRSWLLSLVANAHRRRERAEWRRKRRESAVAEDRREGPPQGDRDECAEVLSSLALLPLCYRRPIEMRYLDGFEFAEIAAALGGSERGMRTRVSRGLERVRQSLVGRSAVPSSASIAALLSAAGGEASASSALVEGLARTLRSAPVFTTGAGLAFGTWAWMIACGLLGACLATFLLHSIGTDPRPAPTAQEEPPALPTVRALPSPIVIDGVVPFPGAFSADGKHFLYALPVAIGAPEPAIMALPISGGARRIAGAMPLHKSGDADGTTGAVMPCGASADLSSIFCTRGGNGLWLWKPSSGACTQVHQDTGDTFRNLRVVPGQSADGRMLGIIDNRKRVIVWDHVTGAFSAPVDIGPRGTYVDHVLWSGDRLLWQDRDAIEDIAHSGPSPESRRWSMPALPEQDDVPSASRQRPVLLGSAPQGTDAFWLGRNHELLRVEGESVSVSARLDPTALSGWGYDEPSRLAIGMEVRSGEQEGDPASVTLHRFDGAGGKPVGDPLQVDVTDATDRLLTASRLELAAPKAANPRVNRRASMIASNPACVAVMLEREVRYGFYGTVYAMIVIIDLADGPRLGPATSVMTWTSSGVGDVVADYPLVLAAPDRGSVVVQLRDQIRLYPLR